MLYMYIPPFVVARSIHCLLHARTHRPWTEAAEHVVFCWHGLFLSNSIQVHKVTCITLFTFQCSSVSLWDMTYALPFGFKHILHQRISSHLWHVNQRGNGSRNGSMFVFPLMSDHRNMSGVTSCGLVDWRRHTWSPACWAPIARMQWHILDVHRSYHGTCIIFQ